jgi:hypothetical protein
MIEITAQDDSINRGVDLLGSKEVEIVLEFSCVIGDADGVRSEPFFVGGRQ